MFFGHIIKDLKNRLPSSLGVGTEPKVSDLVNSRKQDTDKTGKALKTEKGDSGLQGLEFWSHKSRNTWTHQKLEEVTEDSLPEPWEFLAMVVIWGMEPVDQSFSLAHLLARSPFCLHHPILHITK